MEWSISLQVKMTLFVALLLSLTLFSPLSQGQEQRTERQEFILDLPALTTFEVFAPETFESNISLTVKTAFGNYSLDKESGALQVRSRQGKPVVSSARFIVQEWSNESWEDLEQNVTCSLSEGALTYYGETSKGAVNLNVTFSREAPPKLSFAFANSSDLTFRVVFKVTVPALWRSLLNQTVVVPLPDREDLTGSGRQVKLIDTAQLPFENLLLIDLFDTGQEEDFVIRGSTVSVFFSENVGLIDPTLTSYAIGDNYEGYIVSEGDTYPPIDLLLTDINHATEIVGQFYDGEHLYYTYRSYVSFNTSSLPDDVLIFSAHLYLYVTSVSPVEVWIVQVMGGTQPLFDTLTEEDHGCGSEQVGGIDIRSCNVNQYTEAIALQTDQISLTGLTQFELKSSKDSVIAPTGTERLKFSGSAETYKPKLVIAYGYIVPTREGTGTGQTGEAPKNVTETLPEVEAFDWSGIASLGLFGIVGGVGLIAVFGVINRLPKSRRGPAGISKSAKKVPSGYKGRDKR